MKLTQAVVPVKYLDKTKSGLAFEAIPDPEPGRYDIRLELVGKKR